MNQKNKILAFTGHRPNALGGWDENNSIAKHIKEDTQGLLRCAVNEGYTVMRFGMAQGFDTWAIESALEIKKTVPEITIIAAVPFCQFPNVWPAAAVERYYGLLDMCDIIYVVNTGFQPTSGQLREKAKDTDPRLNMSYQAANWNDNRNKWMINEADALLACITTSADKGGTYNAVKYARKLGTRIILYHPDTREVRVEKSRESTAKLPDPLKIPHNLHQMELNDV